MLGLAQIFARPILELYHIFSVSMEMKPNGDKLDVFISTL